MRTDDPRHGTDNGYTNLRCRCDRCREAHSRHCAEFRRRRFDRGCPDHLHGTSNGYGNYGCRCRPCTTAWGQDCAARDRRRRGTAS